MNLVLLYH